MVPFDEAKTYPELVKPICFEILPSTKLLIEIGDTVAQTSLFLDHPSLDQPYELGWDDAGQWHPHVFRWVEFEQLILFLTIRHSKDFVIPFLLMLPFAPVTKEENERAIARKVKAAFRSLQFFTESEIESFDSIVKYKPHFTWNYDEVRGVYHACDSPDDIYSMRHICTDEFPFSIFDEMFHRIEREKNTVAWQEAVDRWERLVQQYSIDEDETWLDRRNQ